MILALSGKKQSGKNTSANYVLGAYMLSLHVVRGTTAIDDKGRLWISDLLGDERITGVFDVYRNNRTMYDFREKHIHPHIKLYSFADLLKKDVCINILGLTYEQCFGTDEQKNSETHLKWEDMPGVVAPNSIIASKAKEYYGLTVHTSGPMTAREVMQFVGTEIFRKMYGDVWAEATIKLIKEEDSGLAIITDCRFPNEVDVVQKAGGKVVRLTRDPFNGEDVHASELALDPDKFDQSKFDAVIDNQNMDIEQQTNETYRVLRSWDFIPEIK